MKKLAIYVFLPIGLCVVAVVVFVTAISMWKARAHDEYSALLIKPDGIRTVGDLLLRNPEIEDVFSITNGDSVNIVVTLKSPIGTDHIYSGPPAYVFDREGGFIEWSEDIGDDNEFWKKWPISRTNQVPEDHLQKLFEPTASPEPPPRASDSESQD